MAHGYPAMVTYVAADARSAIFPWNVRRNAGTEGTFTIAGQEWNNIRTNTISTGHGG
jgi:hypothetical protein